MNNPLIYEAKKNIKDFSQDISGKSFRTITTSYLVSKISLYSIKKIYNIILKKITINIVSTYVKSIANWEAINISIKGANASFYASAAGASAVAGPIGTIAILAVSCPIALAIDWWFTEDLKQKLTNNCNKMISKLEDVFLYGTKDKISLKRSFNEIITTVERAEQKALIKYLKITL